MADQKQGSDSRQIRDVMTADPQCVTDQNSVRDAAVIMKQQDTGVVPVVDGKKVIGIITDRDIVVRGLAEGKNLENMRVSELMTKQVRSVREDATIHEALELMGGSDIRRVTVVNASDEIVGIVSLGDISVTGSNDGKVGRTVESISEAPPNN